LRSKCDKSGGLMYDWLSDWPSRHGRLRRFELLYSKT
jgi:hypothetical protein